MRFRPFDALVPDPARAARVISPPYDVMSTAEAARMAEGNPLSLLHATRSEIGLPADTDPYAFEVYDLARQKLGALLEAGALRSAGKPIYGAYRLTREGHRQTGLVGLASVADYREGVVKKHEFTRPVKEDDRTRHISVTGAQTGPVFLGCRTNPALSALLDAEVHARPADVDVTAPDGVRHEAWWIEDTAPFEAVVEAIDASYICDGHHRAASAARVAELEGTPSAQGFLAVLFSAEQLEIMPYNRVVSDLFGLSEEAFLDALRAGFHVTGPGADPSPPAPHRFSMYLGGQWYGLTARPDILDASDPIRLLDVSVLQDHVLGPILGIEDPRRDGRIDFVGGIRGTGELERRVDQHGGGVAFSLFSTSLDELFRVADKGEVMPPKSTWFEPKLADGMFIHLVRQLGTSTEVGPDASVAPQR